MLKFIVDANVGKLAKWLRLLGYDTRFFDGQQDGEMISTALVEERIILTRDTHIMEWGVVRSARVKAILIASDKSDLQMRQVVRDLGLEIAANAFTLCLECNQVLRPVSKEDVESRVPPYVFITQNKFLSCPKCGRIYWRGTHWRAMVDKMNKLAAEVSES